MTTLDSSVGGSSSNSYGNVANADTYFADSMGRSFWASQDASTKAVALIHATRLLDQYIEWFGTKSTTTQALEWPRYDTSDKSGSAYAHDIIPGPVVFATYELAYYLVQNQGISFSVQAVNDIKVGPIAVKLTDSAIDAGIPNYVEALIKHVGTSISPDKTSAKSVRLIRS
jgi:hypothetical protein